jgi:hypothetical protein
VFVRGRRHAITERIAGRAPHSSDARERPTKL